MDPYKPELPRGDRPAVERPTPRQIWGRSVILGAVLALFISVAFGRFETERIVSLFILWAVPLTLVFGGLFTYLNRPSSGPGSGTGGVR